MSDGEDVRQLETALSELGYFEATPNAHFDWNTIAAIKKWQKALTLPQSGSLPLGTVLFAPEDLRIGALDASPRPGATPRRVEDESVELQRQFRDVHDHVMQIRDRLEDLRTSLQNALTVHDTLVAQQQNEDMKRISAGAAILVVPTIIGSIYGMNFEYLPELKWEYGYPASLLLMVLACVGVYFFFKRRGWF